MKIIKNKKYVAVLLIILSVTLLISIFTGCNRVSKKTPLLRVMVQGPGSWIFPGMKHYYNVYENGKLEKIDEFTFSEVETYSLGDIEDKIKDNDNNESIDTPPYALNIIELMKDMGENFHLGSLYVFNDKCFFGAYDSVKYTSMIFEYFPNKNQEKNC